jgi:sporulation protein YlmC with PRC-barrel domain
LRGDRAKSIFLRESGHGGWPANCKLQSGMSSYRKENLVAANEFEHSRVAGGTLNIGGPKPSSESGGVPNESRAISRDDARDGFDDPEGGRGVSEARKQRRVLAAKTLVGDRVRNSAGEDLGQIEQIMIDISTGRVAYAVLSFGGFLGIGDKLFAVPWNALRIDRGEHQFVIEVDRQTLENAPGFDKNNWPEMGDPAFEQAIHDHYGENVNRGGESQSRENWQKDVTEAGDYAGTATGVNAPSNRSIEYEPTTSYHSAGTKTP